MTRLEMLVVMYSLDKLLEKKETDAAHDVVKKIIREAEMRPKDKKDE